jgi:dTMP kinase
METIDAKGRGAFIVVEGLDRSGKTTQTKRIEDALVGEGYKVKLRRFPGNFTSLQPAVSGFLLVWSVPLTFVL